MPASIVFALFAMILVSPRMTDAVALTLAAVMLFSMLIAIWKSDD